MDILAIVSFLGGMVLSLCITLGITMGAAIILFGEEE